MELFTSRFAYGARRARRGLRAPRVLLPRRRALRRPRAAARRLKLAEHVPDMLRYRRAARARADVVHFQWLTVQQLDGLLLPRAGSRRWC